MNGNSNFVNVSKKSINIRKKEKISKVKTNGLVNNNNHSTGSFIPEASSISTDSVSDGEAMFAKIIGPQMTVNNFMIKHWEKEPFLKKRKDPSYYKDLLSILDINKMLAEQHIEYTKNLDVTSYKDGNRETLNPQGRAMQSHVWDYYNDGCSIRLINPQTFLPNISKMNSILQEYFHCMVGSNIYLTPPHSQGFAPHYDDIEAFVLQIAGQKQWKLYNPRSESEVLPRVSSPNFKQNEIGSPIMDVVLEAGDILYFPRGVIHQAKSYGGAYSLHITLSVYQSNSWADLIELVLPEALKLVIDENVEFRRGLPLDIHKCMGLVNQNSDLPQRKKYLNTLSSLLKKVLATVPIDHAVDLMAKKFHKDALPPFLNTEELKRTQFGQKVIMLPDDKVKIKKHNIKLTTKVRLVRANILRLLLEENEYHLYYHGNNTLEYNEDSANYLEVSIECVPIIQKIIHSYPKYVAISKLSENENLAQDITEELWMNGLLIAEDDI